MTHRFKNTLCALALLPAAGLATAAPISTDAQWYLHANLLEMRQTESGSMLYDWLDDEVLEEVSDELGFDFSDELDGVTVFGTHAPERDDAAVILHGFLSDSTRKGILEQAALHVGLETETRFGRDFHRVGGSMDASGSFDGGYVAFGDQGQTLVTGNESLLDTFLSGDAHFESAKSTNLLTIRAESSLLHGAVDAAGVQKSGGPFDSHLFQNVERMSLVIDDNNGLFDLQVAVTATDPTMAVAIQNIIQGLISLKMLDSATDEAAALLSSLTIETVDRDVQMQLLLDPDVVLELID